MGNYISPGVYVREKDLSERVPNLDTSVAAIVGYSAKGSVDVRLITNIQEFITEYGIPTPGEYFHYSALAFLAQGSRLYCRRASKNALYGGVKIMQSGQGPNLALTTGNSTPTFQTVSGEDILFYVYAKDPGTWNNDLAIRVTNSDATEYTFDIGVYLKDADGNYGLVETWTVSRKQKTDGYGRQLYLEDRINGYSQYIVVADDTSTADTVMPEEQTTNLAVGGGSVGDTITDSEINTGWDDFANPDDIDVRILINGGYATAAVQLKMKTIAEARKDCIAVFDIPYSESTVTTAITWRQTTQNFNSSYCAIYYDWVKIYDQYNDLILEVPPSGYVAAQYAYNDYVSDPWFAPAGFNRGLVNVLGVRQVFTLGERDSLYEAQINPIQTFRGEGISIWGQKTEQTKASALDRVNVRRMLIVLEKAVGILLRGYLFEPNNNLTRFRVRTVLEEYLDNMSARGAFQTEAGDKGYLVVCDTSNNTPVIIDANELHVDIFVKPSRAAEFIQLQTIITKTGVAFTELIAQGALF